MQYRFKTKPMKHQLRALKRAWRKGYIALLWDPGVGKSKVIVDWACALHLSGKLQRLLIICPLSVMGVWEDEFRTHAPDWVEWELEYITPQTTRVAPYKRGLTIAVANYDIVWRRPNLVKRYRPQLVVCDESHRFKKASSRRAMYIRTLKDVTYRAILSGTVAPRSYLDIYAQWVFLNWRRFGTDISDFKEYFIRFGGYMGYKVVGYKHLGELKKKIRLDASVVHKETALDLPPVVEQEVPVSLEPRALEAYDKLAWELFLELEEGNVDVKNAAVKLLRLQQLCGGWLKTEEGTLVQVSKAKIEACQDLLEGLFDARRHCVVFCRFTPEVDAIRNLGTRFKVPTYVLDGRVKDRAVRRELPRDFQAQKGSALFVGQIQSGSLGIDLTRASNTIFYSTTLALDDFIQARDRTHRKGQTRKTFYRYLLVRDSVDEEILDNLRGKRDTLKALLAHPERVLRSSQVDMIDQYKKGVKR